MPRVDGLFAVRSRHRLGGGVRLPDADAALSAQSSSGQAIPRIPRASGREAAPPVRCTAMLVFRRSEKSGPIDIPRGTRVAAENVVFTTMHPVRLDNEDRDVTTLAFHGEQIDGELAGKGTGAPGLQVSVRRPPIVAPMDDHLDLVVAVEETDPLPPEARAVQFDGKTFRIWREVANFAEARSGERVYVVDRLSGTIRFSPAVEITDDRGEMKFGNGLFAAVPAQGREIRLSYRTGGGAQGNLRPETLNTLKDRIAGISVTNPEPATGGRDAESLDAMLVRGPTDFHRLQRAVTARDSRPWPGGLEVSHGPRHSPRRMSGGTRQPG